MKNGKNLKKEKINSRWKRKQFKAAKHEHTDSTMNFITTVYIHIKNTDLKGGCMD